ncbi:hypothetical protein [Methanoregula sp.]|uniref:hypothetical protein n=1 Tax=Methanoregula sp. TaxID=2052170 RepID=UPI00260ADDB4|nr:hypothetical protein [Methanoregula sp.]MDD5143892.1 hypothetical protein [Methanoregula sp.]
MRPEPREESEVFFEFRLVHQNQEDEKNASAFFEETVTFSRTGCSFTGCSL